jgi:hypothetical protein
LPAKIDMANVLRIFQARPRPAHAAPPRPCGPAPPTRPRPAHAVPRRSTQRAAWDTAVGTEATPLVPVPPRAASACPAHARATMSIARRNARARTYDWLLQRGRPQLRSLWAQPVGLDAVGPIVRASTPSHRASTRGCCQAVYATHKVFGQSIRSTAKLTDMHNPGAKGTVVAQKGTVPSGAKGALLSRH